MASSSVKLMAWDSKMTEGLAPCNLDTRLHVRGIVIHSTSSCLIPDIERAERVPKQRSLADDRAGAPATAHAASPASSANAHQHDPP